MNYPKARRNPKPEGQNPKESRSPKSESKGHLGSTNCLMESCACDDGAMLAWVPPTGNRSILQEQYRGNQPEELHERTVRFGEDIIGFAKRIPRTPVNDRLIAQLVGAATSVGANDCEADDSVSGKEFKLKIGTCRKESKETMFFLRMLATSEPSLAADARKLWREAKELNLIFGAIWRK